jgi:hypothetical protein
MAAGRPTPFAKKPMLPAALPEATRREIFLALVQAQDGRLSVLASREKVSRHFRVTLRAIKRIEDEGLAGQWPPLEDV